MTTEITHNLNNIYLATEGEGIHLGIPQVFVRYQGCKIGCINCDSRQTWDFAPKILYKTEELISQIEQIGRGVKRVSITGGDPLHPKIEPAVSELVNELKRRGYYINLEASGVRLSKDLFERVDYISFDYKTLSTGVRTFVPLIVDLAKNFTDKFQIKSVVTDYTDMEDVYAAYQRVWAELSDQALPFPWVITPAYNVGEEFPAARFASIIEWNYQLGSPFRIIGQQHKWIYGTQREDV